MRGVGPVAGPTRATPPSDSAALRNPEPTGMDCIHLEFLTSELTPLLDRRREEARHRRDAAATRSRSRGAGAKDIPRTADRILAAVLYQRRIGIRELLAQLFGVHRSAITKAVTDIRPLLEQHDRRIPDAPARLRMPKDVTAYLDDTQHEIKTAC